LIGMDKIEITEQAQRIGTFETSIEPDQDCCTLCVPKHPETRASADVVTRAEARLDIARLVEAGVTHAVAETISAPAGAIDPLLAAADQRA
jgi:thiamine biosynthesis protein ThiI